MVWKDAAGSRTFSFYAAGRSTLSFKVSSSLSSTSACVYLLVLSRVLFSFIGRVDKGVFAQ